MRNTFTEYLRVMAMTMQPFEQALETVRSHLTKVKYLIPTNTESYIVYTIPYKVILVKLAEG